MNNTIFETYGKQSILKRIPRLIKDRFRITNAMRVMCNKSGFEPYSPKVKKSWLVASVGCFIGAVVTTPIPVTGAVLYPASGYCFNKC